MQDTLAQLVTGAALSEQQAEHLFNEILAGRANEVQVGAMLALVARRGPTVAELVGGARAMRRHAVAIPTEGLASRGVVIDTCGTGGAVKTFNISTAAAFVAAGAEGRTPVLVAKHGGRSRSGRGSAEVLEALGVNAAASPETQRRCLEEAGVCFAYAVHHHPAMKFAAGPRKSLGFPTIFNLLGPLTNPAGATRQLLGVYDERFMVLVGETLKRLGADHAWIVHGNDGLDEITTTAPTRIAALESGGVRLSTLDPEPYGVRRAALADLQQAATLEAAADLLRRVLDPRSSGDERLRPARDIVTLNAAAALVVAAAARDIGEALDLARRAIDTGRAAHALQTLARVSHT